MWPPVTQLRMMHEGPSDTKTRGCAIYMMYTDRQRYPTFPQGGVATHYNIIALYVYKFAKNRGTGGWLIS